MPREQGVLGRKLRARIPRGREMGLDSLAGESHGGGPEGAEGAGGAAEVEEDPQCLMSGLHSQKVVHGSARWVS